MSDTFCSCPDGFSTEHQGLSPAQQVPGTFNVGIFDVGIFDVEALPEGEAGVLLAMRVILKSQRPVVSSESC